MSAVPQILRKAAEHIEAVGFNQDGHYYQRGGGWDPSLDATMPCCTMGALKVVSESESIVMEAALAVARDLGFTGVYPHDYIVLWNDREITTEEQVLERLRATADRVETEEASA